MQGLGGAETQDAAGLLGNCSVRVFDMRLGDGRVAQWSELTAWYPKVLGSNPAFSLTHEPRLLTCRLVI